MSNGALVLNIIVSFLFAVSSFMQLNHCIFDVIIAFGFPVLVTKYPFCTCFI